MACIITYENKQYTQKEFEQYFKEHFTEFVGEFITTKPDVILPIGTSGSGKSTFIKSLPQKNLAVIEPDAMRVEFTGDLNDKSKDKEIYIEAANRAIKAINEGKQVVFDTTNLTKDKRLPFIQAIKAVIPNANIQYKLMELNPELAKQRIKAQLERGENRAAVSDETIDRHAISYKQMLEDIKNEPITEYKKLGSKQDIERFKEFVTNKKLLQNDNQPHVETDIKKEIELIANALNKGFLNIETFVLDSKEFYSKLNDEKLKNNIDIKYNAELVNDTEEKIIETLNNGNRELIEKLKIPGQMFLDLLKNKYNIPNIVELLKNITIYDSIISSNFNEKLPENVTFNSTVSLREYNKPLPEGIVFNKKVDLFIYNKPLPKKITFNDEVSLPNYNHPLPEGIVFNGDVKLINYNHPLPKGIVFNGEVDLNNYNEPLPEGIIFNERVDLSKYNHPLPKNTIFNGYTNLESYNHPFPEGIVFNSFAILNNYNHPLPEDIKFNGNTHLLSYNHPIPANFKGFSNAREVRLFALSVPFIRTDMILGPNTIVRYDPNIVINIDTTVIPKSVMSSLSNLPLKDTYPIEYGLSYTKVPGYLAGASGKHWRIDINVEQLAKELSIPKEFFYSFNFHNSYGTYPIGWVGGTIDNDILYITEVQSDLLQSLFVLTERWQELNFLKNIKEKIGNNIHKKFSDKILEHINEIAKNENKSIREIAIEKGYITEENFPIDFEWLGRFSNTMINKEWKAYKSKLENATAKSHRYYQYIALSYFVLKNKHSIKKIRIPTSYRYNEHHPKVPDTIKSIYDNLGNVYDNIIIHNDNNLPDWYEIDVRDIGNNNNENSQTFYIKDIIIKSYIIGFVEENKKINKDLQSDLNNALDAIIFLKDKQKDIISISNSNNEEIELIKEYINTESGKNHLEQIEEWVYYYFNDDIPLQLFNTESDTGGSELVDTEGNVIESNEDDQSAKNINIDINKSYNKNALIDFLLEELDIELKQKPQNQAKINAIKQRLSEVNNSDNRFFYDNHGIVYGYAIDNKIYLNKDTINPNLLFEEAGHIWINWAKYNRQDLYLEGINKVKGSIYEIEVRNNKYYIAQALLQGEKGSIRYEQYIMEEALSKAIADNGDNFIGEYKNKFKEWINKFFKAIAELLGLNNMSADEIKLLSLKEFAINILHDLFTETEINQQYKLDNNLAKEQQKTTYDYLLEKLTENFKPYIKELITNRERADEVIQEYKDKEDSQNIYEEIKYQTDNKKEIDFLSSLYPEITIDFTNNEEWIKTNELFTQKIVIEKLNEINTNLKEFLSQFGFKLEQLEDLEKTTGYNIIGATDFLEKIIFAKESELNEAYTKEAAYVIFNLLGRKNILRKDLIASIHLIDNYHELKSKYVNSKLSDYQIRQLIAVDYLRNKLIDAHKETLPSSNKAESKDVTAKNKLEYIILKIKKWWSDTIRKYFEKYKKNYLEDVFNQIANDVLNNNTRLFNLPIKKDYKKIELNGIQKEINDNLVKIGFINSGSYALNRQGTMIRDEMKDLDYFVPYYLVNTVVEEIKKIYPQTIFSTPYSGVMGNRAVTMTINIEGVNIDLFLPTSEEESEKIKIVVIDNVKYQYWKNIFDAKIRIGSKKHLSDLAGFVPFQKEWNYYTPYSYENIRIKELEKKLPTLEKELSDLIQKSKEFKNKYPEELRIHIYNNMFKNENYSDRKDEKAQEYIKAYYFNMSIGSLINDKEYEIEKIKREIKKEIERPLKTEKKKDISLSIIGQRHYNFDFIRSKRSYVYNSESVIDYLNIKNENTTELYNKALDFFNKNNIDFQSKSLYIDLLKNLNNKEKALIAYFKTYSEEFKKYYGQLESRIDYKPFSLFYNTKGYYSKKSILIDQTNEPVIFYHGAGTTFDKFSKDYFNTGEGAMAFGAGFYATNYKPTADNYKETAKSAYKKFNELFEAKDEKLLELIDKLKIDISDSKFIYDFINTSAGIEETMQEIQNRKNKSVLLEMLGISETKVMYVALTNPLYWNLDISEDNKKAIEKEFNIVLKNTISGAIYRELETRLEIDSKEISARLYQIGIDGTIHTTGGGMTVGGFYHEKGETHIVFFEPVQAKAITNSGLFSLTNENMYDPIHVHKEEEEKENKEIYEHIISQINNKELVTIFNEKFKNRKNALLRSYIAHYLSRFLNNPLVKRGIKEWNGPNFLINDMVKQIEKQDKSPFNRIQRFNAKFKTNDDNYKKAVKNLHKLYIKDLLVDAFLSRFNINTKDETINNLIDIEINNTDLENDALYQYESTMPELTEKALNTIVSNLKNRFNVRIKIVESQEDFIGRYNVDGSIELNKNKIKADTPFHEVSHALIEVIEEQHYELYNNLKEEIIKERTILESIKNNPKYSFLDEELQIKEAIATAIGQYSAGFIDKETGLGLINAVKEFFKTISKYMLELLTLPGNIIFWGAYNKDTQKQEIAKKESAILKPNMTLAQLGAFLAVGEKKLNLNLRKREIINEAIEYENKHLDVVNTTFNLLKEWDVTNYRDTDETIAKKIKELYPDVFSFDAFIENFNNDEELYKQQLYNKGLITYEKDSQKLLQEIELVWAVLEYGSAKDIFLLYVEYNPNIKVEVNNNIYDIYIVPKEFEKNFLAYKDNLVFFKDLDKYITITQRLNDGSPLPVYENHDDYENILLKFSKLYTNEYKDKVKQKIERDILNERLYKDRVAILSKEQYANMIADMNYAISTEVRPYLDELLLWETEYKLKKILFANNLITYQGLFSGLFTNLNAYLPEVQELYTQKKIENDTVVFQDYKERKEKILALPEFFNMMEELNLFSKESDNIFTDQDGELADSIPYSFVDAVSIANTGKYFTDISNGFAKGVISLQASYEWDKKLDDNSYITSFERILQADDLSVFLKDYFYPDYFSETFEDLKSKYITMYSLSSNVKVIRNISDYKPIKQDEIYRQKNELLNALNINTSEYGYTYQLSDIEKELVKTFIDNNNDEFIKSKTHGFLLEENSYYTKYYKIIDNIEYLLVDFKQGYKIKIPIYLLVEEDLENTNDLYIPVITKDLNDSIIQKNNDNSYIAQSVLIAKKLKENYSDTESITFNDVNELVYNKFIVYINSLNDDLINLETKNITSKDISDKKEFLLSFLNIAFGKTEISKNSYFKDLINNTIFEIINAEIKSNNVYTDLYTEDDLQLLINNGDILELCEV